MLNNLKGIMNNGMDKLNAKVIMNKAIFDNNYEIAKKDVKKVANKIMRKEPKMEIAQGFKYEGKYKANGNK